jgi:hypothetical protein
MGLAGTGVAVLAASIPLSGCGRVAARPPAFKLQFFSAEEYRTVERLAQVMLPGSPGAPSASELEVARQADRLLGGADPVRQEQLHQVLALFEDVPIVAGKWQPFTRQDVAGAQEYLRAWQTSRIALLRQGFNGLKRLAAGIYFADPRSWEAIGYEGAWVGTRDLGYGADNQEWGPLVNPHVYATFDA